MNREKQLNLTAIVDPLLFNLNWYTREGVQLGRGGHAAMNPAISCSNLARQNFTLKKKSFKALIFILS